MFKEEELNKLFNQEVINYFETSNYIEFTIDLKLLGVKNNKFLQRSRFQLGDNGLLEVILTVNGGIFEYNKKVNILDDLKYAVLHLEEWEDDWNQDE